MCPGPHRGGRNTRSDGKEGREGRDGRDEDGTRRTSVGGLFGERGSWNRAPGEDPLGVLRGRGRKMRSTMPNDERARGTTAEA